MDSVLSLDPWRTWLVLAPLGAVTAVAALWDARARRIPNWLTYPAFVFGLAARGLALGWRPLGLAFLAALLVFALGLGLMSLGAVGGGDVKLLMCVAAFMGLAGLGAVFFYSVVAGGVLGLAYALLGGRLGATARRLIHFVAGLWRKLVYGTAGFDDDQDDGEERSEIPFGIAVFTGVVLASTEAHSGWPGLLTWYLAHTPFGSA